MVRWMVHGNNLVCVMGIDLQMEQWKVGKMAPLMRLMGFDLVCRMELQMEQ